jgi:hypothetical protein
MADGTRNHKAADSLRSHRVALQFGWHRRLPMML